MKKISLVWLRRDLRLHDNEVLYQAAQFSEGILPFYIIDPYHFEHREACLGRNAFILHSLSSLQKSFLKLGANLKVFRGSPLSLIEEIIKSLLEAGYELKFFYSTDIQYAYDRDLELNLKKLLEFLKVPLQICRNDFLLFNESAMDSWRETYYEYLREPSLPAPERLVTPRLELPASIDLAELCEKNRCLLSPLFKPGEEAAWDGLETFLDRDFKGYHWKLSRPWMASQGATSHLSPHLAQGTISSRTVHQKVYALRKSLADEKGQFSLRAFADRLRWRDSFRQRFYFHPEWAEENRYPEFDTFYTSNPLSAQKQQLFEAWSEGRTGFPMVDASMRQLKNEGWINFRMRAMCATFLSINCGISWHYGSQHFMNCLIDGDVAIDHWQWQMQAGVINPLVPTFRIYNPQKNLQERDPDLHYVKHWVPELKEYSLNEILNFQTPSYSAPILNWSQTKASNGKQISALRNAVKERLIRTQDDEYLAAAVSRKVVEKYYESKQQSYARMKGNLQLKFDFEESNE